jgi:hypothetical protein
VMIPVWSNFSKTFSGIVFINVSLSLTVSVLENHELAAE